MSLNASPADNCEIQLLGGFRIIYKGNEISDASVRTKKAWMLIQYLIANRNNAISVDRLVSDIWGQEESRDPLNVLKNLVYRARNILKELCPDEDTEFILYSRDSYCWNGSIPWQVDTEKFEECIHRAESAGYDNDKITAYYDAFCLYRGEFLPKSAYCDWVLRKSTYYATLFITCTVKLCKLLEQQKRFDEIIHICENAVDIYSYEEKLHEQLLRAYISSGRFSKALSHYNYISKLFYNELGVCLSDGIKALYQKIISSISAIEMDLSLICEDLNESSQQKQAFFCDYEIFKNFYQMQARAMARTGQSINVALLTLSGLDQTIPENDILKSSMQLLKDTILSNLRRADVVSAFSSIQFVLMLPSTTYENAQMICQRIIDKFLAKDPSEQVKIIANVRPLKPIDL
ncbi:BTAD domain-containing putative transcriptional regulator [Fumia xinanensis]|uniref:Winged helix-turn-helix domain-containing protein n=1 Tax=Fumia xinanensis TaxID=2763659 RepID=A0A926E5C0_9FIRM|nr:BTAD domain-containing putative transcriptional regulator [Fumia xinanensis]MBC8560542.1 winged helix-turn-helix domain-containing protein [Fumia xinanensis]